MEEHIKLQRLVTYFAAKNKDPTISKKLSFLSFLSRSEKDIDGKELLEAAAKVYNSLSRCVVLVALSENIDDDIEKENDNNDNARQSEKSTLTEKKNDNNDNNDKIIIKLLSFLIEKEKNKEKLYCYYDYRTYEDITHFVDGSIEAIKRYFQRECDKNDKWFSKMSCSPIKIKTNAVGRNQLLQDTLEFLKLDEVKQQAEEQRQKRTDDIIKVLTKDDHELVINMCELAESDPELANEIITEPTSLDFFIVAIEEAGKRIGIEANRKPEIIITNLPKAQHTTLAAIRSKHMRQLVQIRAIIPNIAQPGFKLIQKTLQCPSCGTTIRCKGEASDKTHCKCGVITKWIHIKEEDIFIDSQRVWLEEPQDETIREKGRSVPAVIYSNLVSEHRQVIYNNADPVIIVGRTATANRTKKDEVNQELTFEIMSIEPEKKQEISISEDKIKKFLKSETARKELIKQVSPSITDDSGYMDDVKFGLFLSAVSGSRKNTKDRDHCHCLMFGPPGTAKTHLLKWFHSLVPGALMASGATTSSVGLTAAVVKDQHTQQWILKKGLMSRGNGNIVCIEELGDISPEDQAYLKQAMEDGQFQIAKADIIAMLQSNTVVMAACNPVNGERDTYSSLISQLYKVMKPTIIDRFDLIFWLDDKINEKEDMKIASSMLHRQGDDDYKNIDFVKQIAFYLRHCVEEPTLSEDCIQRLTKLWVDLRQASQKLGAEGIKIRKRALDNLKRLTIAIAKFHLHKVATARDSEEAIALYKVALESMGMSAVG